MGRKPSIDFSAQKVQFGKYKGRLVSWVVDNDPMYAEWLAKSSNSQTRTKRSAIHFLHKKDKTC